MRLATGTIRMASFWLFSCNNSEQTLLLGYVSRIETYTTFPPIQNPDLLDWFVNQSSVASSNETSPNSLFATQKKRGNAGSTSYV